MSATEQVQAALLALLGTADFDALPPPPVGSDQDNLRWYLHRACASAEGHQVLANRRPAWLPELAQQHLEYGHWMWTPVWRLVVDAVIERPSTPEYYDGLIHAGLGADDTTVAEMVARDPRLLDRDLPGLLDRPDGLARLVRRDARRVGIPTTTEVRVWSPVLAGVPAEHPLRRRLVTELVDALAGDLGPAAAAHHQFATAMGITPAEYADHARALLRLAGHRQPAIVSFGISTLSKVDKKRPLDPAVVLAHVGPATGALAAGTAKAAVGLIAAALRRDPTLAAAAAEALRPGLTHRKPEIQLAAVTVLGSRPDEPAVAAVLADVAAGLSPTARAAVPTIATEPAVRPEVDQAAELAAALAEAEAVLARRPDADPDVAVAIAAARAGSEPPPARPDPVRDARPEEPISPVETLDVLVETLLQVVDGKVRNTSTAERALDGLAALHAARPHDFALLVGPLVVRVNEIFAAESPLWGRHCSTDFCYLIAQWIQPERPIAEPITVDSPRAWLIARLREVAVTIQAGTSVRLLALPTDETDWIDPAVLAERVLAIGDEALGRPHDVAIALARLAPWGRPAARKRLADATGTLAAVVRAGCGGEEVVDEAPELVRRMLHWQNTRPVAGVPYLFGDAPPPAPEPTKYPRDIYGQATVRPMPDGGLYFDVSHVPEWQAFERWRQHEEHSRYAPAWGVSQWPGASEWIWSDPWLGRQRIRWLVNPDMPFPAAAADRVVALLGDDAAEIRTLATDIVTQAIGDGRLTSAALGLALAAGFAAPTGARLAPALSTVVSTGPLHRSVVVRALIATVATWKTLPARPLCGLLELLDEAFTADGVGLASNEARSTLATLARGRSKTATLTARVLAHPAVDPWTPTAARAALAARVRRSMAQSQSQL